MGNDTHIVLKAPDRSYLAILKKEIHNVCVSAGFSAKKISEIDIIVAELASNLVKHAGGGELLVKLVEENNIAGIEIISIDSGPGIADINRVMLDGVSSRQTLGIGLGSIKRLSDVFQLYSQKGWGTIVLARIFEKERPMSLKKTVTEIRSLVFPKTGEELSGDGFVYKVEKDKVKMFLGDGLGHGPEAAEAVRQAGNSFLDCNSCDPVEIIRSMNTAVKKTRGLVGTVVIFDMKSKSWKLCGVGNISTRITGPTISKNYIAYNGIIGMNLPRTLNVQEIEYEKGQLLLCCSDGLKSRWDLLRHNGILRYDLSVICACLVKDFARHTDDTSVAGCKITL
ncbi:ATP-binding SpoIIE family protein phosphatase [Flavihumibacter solisilvae]|uniref:Serine/threonine protein kinase n=1 Tax=Flavihumibacter solisilvae TaxID=1349421 RepID=A0A0C1ITC1_9BACT|nr:ATP-binding SpoIIE family protein phosphatase [Flavihumibacter solisilvae]KIC93684.1 serine/threonine protein kinase [Flavihumibacter solisilvae]